VSNTAAGECVSDALRGRLDAAVAAGSLPEVTERVKAALQEALRAGTLTLADRFRQARPDTYARRLLHRDPDGRYTMVVMTWGPGQGTALHDHAGIWCVECVVDGLMEVAQYELTTERDGAYTFVERNRVKAGRGSAGCLIPPFEYHTLANAASGSSVTLHVYGGEMDHCHIFEPSSERTWRRVRKELAYHQ
jgi:predicted metal-dependent enzyme (double-stranded beta helix superfamily)